MVSQAVAFLVRGREEWEEWEVWSGVEWSGVEWSGVQWVQWYAKTPCFSAFLTKSGTLKKMVLNYIQPPIAPPNHVRIR